MINATECGLERAVLQLKRDFKRSGLEHDLKRHEFALSRGERRKKKDRDAERKRKRKEKGAAEQRQFYEQRKIRNTKRAETSFPKGQKNLTNEGGTLG
jgi:hypothetical protein